MHGGPGAASLYDAQRVTQQQVELQDEVMSRADQLVSRLEAAWVGDASYEAWRVIRSFADVADESSRRLASNARTIEGQVHSFERVNNSLEVMPDPPPRRGAFNPDFGGRLRRKIRRYEEQAARNRERYQFYVDDTLDNVDNVDNDYGKLPEGWGRGPGGVEPGPNRPGGPDVDAPVVRGPGGIPIWPGSDLGGNGNGSGSDDGRFSGTIAAAAGSTASGLLPGAIGAFGAGGAGGFGAGGFGSGGPDGLVGGVGSGSGAPGGQTGAGGPGGVGAGGAGRGGLGGMRGGMAGGAPMAGAGGRGRRDDDDDEHRSSLLQENDPEGLFGTDELTPPPVIGEDDDDD